MTAMLGSMGHSLGRYRLLAELGRDDSGRIYQAEDTLQPGYVRLWVANESLAAHDPSLKRRLAQAVDQAAALDSPRVVRPQAVAEIDGRLCLISPYVEGKTLREEMQQAHTLPWERARQIASDLADALGAAHRAGLGAIDLTPANVIVTPDGRALLSELALLPLPRPLVQVGGRLVAGAAAYMAPEVARGEPQSAASAVYALGMILYEMLAGHPSFQGNDSEVILAHMNQDPAPVAQANRRAPAAVDGLLARCLAKDPQQRYASTAELVAALQGITTGRAALPRVPKRALPIAIAVLALVALITLGWGLLSGRPAPSERPSPDASLATGQMGTYEVTIPKRLRPGDSAQVRLAVHIAEAISPEDLPASPPMAAQSGVDTQLLGAIPLCKQLWARLEAPTLRVAGPATVRRTLRTPGAEWLWDVGCEAEMAPRGKQPATLQIFVRQGDGSDAATDLLVKEIAFSIPVSDQPFALPDGALLIIGLALAALAIALLVVTLRGRRGAGSMTRRD